MRPPARRAVDSKKQIKEQIFHSKQLSSTVGNNPLRTNLLLDRDDLGDIFSFYDIVHIFYEILVPCALS